MLAKYQQIQIELERFLAEIDLVPPNLSQQVAKAMLYVHEHLFDSDLNVKVIKAKCCLRDNNVTLRFRTEVGTGLRDYIEHLRLEAADRLLRLGNFPVYLVAMSVGYRHPETFCRAFSRRFGCNPSYCNNDELLQ